MMRSSETEQSVQYTVHSLSSPTSFRPHIWAARRTVERGRSVEPAWALAANLGTAAGLGKEQT